ncbi:hypothetical protein HDV00_009000 [Rhizophlyctis rosea]|nr:hypothetical protein HDV00_009000 [Rhizophlyctis rosea]
MPVGKKFTIGREIKCQDLINTWTKITGHAARWVTISPSDFLQEHSAKITPSGAQEMLQMFQLPLLPSSVTKRSSPLQKLFNDFPNEVYPLHSILASMAYFVKHGLRVTTLDEWAMREWGKEDEGVHIEMEHRNAPFGDPCQAGESGVNKEHRGLFLA